MRIDRFSICFAILTSLTALADLPRSPEPAPSVSPNTVAAIRQRIVDVRRAGHPRYRPKHIYVVDPAQQRLFVLAAESVLSAGEPVKVELTLAVGTGANGVGFEDGQTPPGFFTMGGVRIADRASSDIQTGDTRPGVSGIYAELLYPPDHPDKRKRGRVPINVVIHSFNPKVSEALRRRYEEGLIGKKPCTTGCPVVHPQDAIKLVPFLKESAGAFDPATKPGAALGQLIRKRLVVEYSRAPFARLGDPIFVIDPGESPAFSATAVIRDSPLDERLAGCESGRALAPAGPLTRRVRAGSAAKPPPYAFASAKEI